MATVSSVPKNPVVGHQYSLSPSVPYLLCMYLCPARVCTVLVIHVRYATYKHLYLGLVRECDYVHARTFSRNIWAFSSVHTCILSRNNCARAHTIFHAQINVCSRAHMIFRARSVCARTYVIFCARASVRILARTSMCICVCSWVSASMHALAPASICACSGCSLCMSVVLSNRTYKISLRLI